MFYIIVDETGRVSAASEDTQLDDASLEDMPDDFTVEAAGDWKKTETGWELDPLPIDKGLSPTEQLIAVNYRINDIEAAKVDKAGDVMTGNLTIGTPGSDGNAGYQEYAINRYMGGAQYKIALCASNADAGLPCTELRLLKDDTVVNYVQLRAESVIMGKALNFATQAMRTATLANLGLGGMIKQIQRLRHRLEKNVLISF